MHGFSGIFSLILFLVVFLNPSHPSASENVKVGIYQNKPLIFTESDDGEYAKGIFADLLKHIAKQENWTLSWVSCKWDDCLEMLKEEEIDIIGSIAESDERKRQFVFSKEPVLLNWGTMYVSDDRDPDIVTLVNLHKAKVAVLKGDIYLSFFYQLMGDNNIKPVVVEYGSYDDVLGSVEEKQTEYGLVNRFYGLANEKNYSVARTHIMLGPVQIQFAANKRSRHLLALIDSHLARLKADRKSVYYSSMFFWLHHLDAEIMPKWLKFMLLMGAGVVLFLLSSSMVLRKQVRKRTKDLSYALEQIHGAKSEIIMRLAAAAEHRDPDTGYHIKRIGFYSLALARYMGMSDDFCRNIFLSSQLHDIGKIGIPDVVLLKRGGLSADEYDMMKKHTLIGQMILGGSSNDIIQMAELISLQHHERWDGSGYPLGLKGEEIGIEARIVILADQYDALRSQRPYKPSYGHEECVRIITEGDERTSPMHFDPAVLNAFKAISFDFNDIFLENRPSAGTGRTQ